MLDAIISKIKLFDSSFENHINLVLSSYYPIGEAPYLSQRLALFIRVGFYTFFVLIPTLILRVKYEEKAIVSFFLILILSVIGLSIALTFFGFFQLLYTYP